MATLEPTWRAPQRSSTVSTALSDEIAETQRKLAVATQRITQSFKAKNDRKSTLGAELKKLEIQSLQSQMDDIAESMKYADTSKRQSKMQQAKMQHDLSALEKAQQALAPSDIATSRRNLIRSVKISKGWSDDSAEWKAMEEKEKEMERLEQQEREATERKIREVEAQLKRKMKVREQERLRHQQAQLERLKKQLESLEAEDPTADLDEDAMAKEVERRRQELAARQQLARKERERQRAEDERLRREKEEAVMKRKAELEQRSRELEEALWRKEEERLAKEQQRLDEMQRRLDSGEVSDLPVLSAQGQAAENERLKRQLAEMEKKVSAAAGGADVSAKLAEVQAREQRLQEHERRLEQLADRLQRLPDVDSLLRAIERIQLGGAQNTASAAAASSSTRKTAEQYKQEIASLQAVIFDAKATPQQIDKANIELEKLMGEYEKTPEYRAEIERAAAEKRAKHEPLNQEALVRMKAKYSQAAVRADPTLVQRIAEHPELRILFMEQETVARIHYKDYAAFTLRGLTLDELRALRASMPRFTREQHHQRTWVEQLDDKIEAMAAAGPQQQQPEQKKAPAPPRLPRPAAPRAAPTGDIFEEIKRRAGRPAGSSPSPSSAALPPLPAAPKSLARAAPALPPLPKSAPALPPLPKPSALPPSPPTQPAPTSSPAPHAKAVTAVQTTLERLVKLLSAPSQAEKEIANETRSLVSEIKALAAVVPNRALEPQLQDCASDMVVAVKGVLVARRAGGQEMQAAKTRLVAQIDTLRRLIKSV